MLGGKLSMNIFGHVFFKACQYAVDDEKVYRGFKYVSIKSVETNF
jgi:hypothetical protein